MTSVAGRIFDIQRFSLHDGPGIRTTVFLKGCPMRCPWCSNPESQKPGPEIMWFGSRCLRCGRCVAACPRGAIAWNGAPANGEGAVARSSEAAGGPGIPGPLLARASCNACGECVSACPSAALRLVGEGRTAPEVLDTVVRDRPFFNFSGGGMTVSGGEPMLQPDFTISLLAAARKAGIPGVLETAGSCEGDEILSAARLCELVMFDIKHYDPQEHRSLTGAGNERIRRNLGLLVQAGVPVRVRVPLVYGLTATADNIQGIAAFLRDLSSGGRRAGHEGAPLVELMPYHALGAGKYAALGRVYPMIRADGAGDTGAVSTEWAEGLQAMVREISGLACRVAGLPPS